MRFWREFGPGSSRSAGSFGSRLSDGVDGLLPVLGEVLEAFDRFEPKAANDGQGCIS
jgi:hypothetical protein